MPRKPREPLVASYKPRLGDESDNDDAEVAIDHLPHASVRKGLIERPFPGRSWGQLFKRPLHHSPWPYLENEIQQIEESLLPQPISRQTIDHIVIAARKYIRAGLLRREGNANPETEIARVRRSLADAIAALEDLSIEAKNHLVENWGAVNSNDPLPGNISELKHALGKFELRISLMNHQPPKARRGAPTKNHEAWLTFRIREAFAAAHGGKSPARGLPQFHRACVEPLKHFGLPETISTDTWDDKLRKPRNKSDKKR
jgi:hypothetical protein